MSFKISVCWSVLVHAGLLMLHSSSEGAPLGPRGPYVMVELKKSIEISPAAPGPGAFFTVSGEKVPDPFSGSAPPPHRVVTPLPDWQFLVIQHKQRVRAYLKSRLRYPAVQVEGTVRMRLNLTAEGILKTAEVLQASDPRLTQAALDDARAAAPYPRFLPGMKRRPASYEFLVRYEAD